MTLVDDPVQAGSGHGGTGSVGPGSSLRARFSRIDWLYEVCFLGGVLGAAALALSLVGRRSGWPQGQTPPDPFLVQIYAAHIRNGDLFPVWSSSDAYGMGTPVVLFYQRTFFMVGGLIFIVLGGSLKATLVVTLGIFMVVGAYGMRAALGVVTESRLLQTVGSIAFILTNWSFSEWLIRGDLAEFSAFMLVPWLIYWCLALVKDRRLSWSIIPVMVLLVWAHNTVALASIILLVVTGAVFIVRHGITGLRAVARRFVLSMGAIAVILAPGFVAEIKMGNSYDPARTIIYDNMKFGSFSFPHPFSYLYNPSFRWLAASTIFKEVPFETNIQLDFAISLLLALGLLTVLIHWLRKTLGRSSPSPSPPHINGAVITVLVVSFAIYMFLQFRISLRVWYAFWELKVLGYPFRMMTFAVPIALILAIVVADWYLRAFRMRHPTGRSGLPAVLAALWLASFVLLSPVTAHEPSPSVKNYVPVAQLTASPHATFQTSSASPLFGEYLPKLEGANRRLISNDNRFYTRLHRRHREAASLSSVPCTVIETSGSTFESLMQTYVVNCKRPTRLALPISSNSYTSIDEQTAGASQAVAVLRVPDDPRIVIRIQSAGPHTFVVHLPTLMGILF